MNKNPSFYPYHQYGYQIFFGLSFPNYIKIQNYKIIQGYLGVESIKVNISFNEPTSPVDI